MSIFARNTLIMLTLPVNSEGGKRCHVCRLKLVMHNLQKCHSFSYLNFVIIYGNSCLLTENCIFSLPFIISSRLTCGLAILKRRLVCTIAVHIQQNVFLVSGLLHLFLHNMSKHNMSKPSVGIFEPTYI